MGKQLLYQSLAKYYDQIYHWKDYKKEAQAILKLISKHKKSKGKELLEVGCGTGHHLKYLKRFHSIGVDINDEILKVARKENPGVRFVKQDMIKLKMGRQFDVILCMFSSIGYVKTYTNLYKTLKKFYDYLVPGGIAIIEPWFEPKDFKGGIPFLHCFDGDVKIARVSRSSRKGDISILEMNYLIADKKGVRYYKDFHELGLFTRKRTLAMMREIGFKSKFLSRGFLKARGVFVCLK